MGFARGVLGTVTPGRDLRTAIEALLPASGWALVDTYTGTSPADDIRVWKNPAANNASGIDFFVALRIPAGTVNQLGFSLAQVYDPATHLARKYCPDPGASVTVDPADYTAVDAAGNRFETVNVVAKNPFSVTGGQGYAVSVTKDMIIADGYNNNNYNPCIVGHFVKDSSSAIDNCLVNLQFASFQNSPSLAVGSTQAMVGNSLTDFQVFPTVDGFIGLVADPLNNNKPYSSRLIVLGSHSVLSTVYGVYRGYFRDLLYIPNTFANYDDDITVTIGGSVKTYGRVGANIWVDKAAV